MRYALALLMLCGCSRPLPIAPQTFAEYTSPQGYRVLTLQNGRDPIICIELDGGMECKVPLP